MGGSDSGSDSSDSGSMDFISQSSFLRNRGVDVGGDDVTDDDDTDYDSVEDANTDSFENTDDAVTEMGDDGADANSFGAGLFAEEGAEGDLVTAGNGDEG